MRVPELPFSLFEGYSAQASLSLAYDGRIPDGWMDLARDYDRAHPLPLTEQPSFDDRDDTATEDYVMGH